MNIELSITYSEPQLRRLDVVVDGEPWYQEFLAVRSGLIRNLPIRGHYLSIKIAAAPLERES